MRGEATELSFRWRLGKEDSPACAGEPHSIELYQQPIRVHPRMAGEPCIGLRTANFHNGAALPKT